MSYDRICILQLITVFDLEKNLVSFIAKYAVDANLFQLGSSIQKHAGSMSAAPVGATREAKPPSKKNDRNCFFDKIFFRKNFKHYFKK